MHFKIREQDNQRDISGDIGSLLVRPAEPAIPMYSFDRPARMLWQCVYDGLIARGWSDADAIAWLQSRGPRHLLDGIAREWISDLADRVAGVADRSYHAYPVDTHKHQCYTYSCQRQ